LTILDEGDEEGVPVGMRLLPEMRIDSEIGHSDAHVLRNVGKIERFIADVVRKTLVDELVFPNFHTIAL
jgi:distribution and morphology protein 12